MARTYRLTVGHSEAGLRLDHYLTRRLPSSVSRGMIQRGIREGRITVGGRRVKVHYKLRRDDVVVATFAHLAAPSGALTPIPQDIPLAVVFEDSDLLVVNKPAGLVTHPAPGHWDGTLVNAILWHLQSDKGTGIFHGKCLSPSGKMPVLARAGIVHRLDKDTSGLLLVAKTERAHASLSKQLKARTIHRCYLALVEGHLPLHTGTIDAPIGRHLVHRKEMTVRHLGGRAAVTHYQVLKRLSAREAGDSKIRGQAFSTENACPLLSQPTLLYSVVDVSLETGRTHQIRVHLAHLGYPVLGDLTYGKHPASFWQGLGISRQLLHAYQLTFQHPVTGKSLTFSASPPADLEPWLSSG